MSFFRRLALLAVAAGAVLLDAAPVSFRTTQLPWAALDSEYRAPIQTQGDGRCALGDVVLSIVDGLLPEGLMLQGDSIAGVPRQMGIFQFRIRAATNCAHVEQEYRLQVTAKPILRLSADELAFDYHVGDRAPEPKIVLVASTWPALAYSVTGDVPWLRIRMRGGVTPRPGSAFSGDAATVEVVPADLNPGVYETSLVFRTRQSDIAPAVRVKLRVSPALAASAQTEK